MNREFEAQAAASQEDLPCRGCLGMEKECLAQDDSTWVLGGVEG